MSPLSVAFHVRPRCVAPAALVLVTACGLALASPRTVRAQSPGIAVELHDANPRFTDGEYLAGFSPEELVRLDVPRRGTVADGVSRLLLKIRAPAPGEVALQLGSPRDGSIATPWQTRTHAIGNEHYVFALYVPPESYGEGSGRRRPDRLLNDEVEYRDVEIGIRYVEAGGAPPRAERYSLKLARPPVVLVHGTFDNPDGAWREASERGLSMVASLERVGFRPFAVDYRGSNGTGRGGGGWLMPGSGFRDNRRVVLDNPDGIRDALRHYREELGLAVARADVVGHSMGGLLARVLASEAYQEEGDEPYRTAENFNEGWIHRLITISTPHHGSELPEVLRFLWEAELDGESWLDWMVARGAVLLLGWFGGVQADVGAVHDQLPRSPALRRIRATRVPAHAIVTTVDYNRLRDDRVDEDRRYFHLFRYVAMGFHYNPGLLDRFLEHRIEQRRDRPEHLRRPVARDGRPPPEGVAESYRDPEQFRAVYREAMDAEWAYWQTLRDERWLESVEEIARRPMLPPGMVEVDPVDPDPDFWSAVYDALESAGTYAFGFDLVEPERGGERIAPPVPHTLIEQLRALIFHNDRNDGTVRYDSQTGSLEDPYITYIPEGVLHSFSPRYGRVQNAVIDRLKNDDGFAAEGFPPAGRWLPSWLPETRIVPERVGGDEAICWSGMVPAHARKYARVAQADSVIVITRPVNPDATPLIAGGAATKPMAIKGKSSSWGPQVGYIPVSQRFSKLWEVYTGAKREEQIRKYDAEVVESLAGDPPLAVAAPLLVEVAGQRWEVREDPSEADAVEAIRLVRETGEAGWESCDWRTGDDDFSRSDPPSPDRCETIPSLDSLRRLEVLASGTETDDEGNPRYLTADYDLLAFGLHLPGAPHDPPIFTKEDFDPQTGFITPRQEEVLRELNQAVRTGASAYPGGNVSHHGPENQYPKSPYVDYPLTVFEPGPGEPRIFSIKQGPPGFRDLHLKRYFHRKRGEGFDLYTNPSPQAGWLWTVWRPYDPIRGYDDRDAPELPPYVAEQPFPESCEIEPATLVVADLEEEPTNGEEPEADEEELAPLAPIVVARQGAGRATPGADPPAETAGRAGATTALLIYDDIEVFFQPARDTTRTAWEWRIVRVRPDAPRDTAVAASGVFSPPAPHEDNTERAPAGAPAAFHTIIHGGSMWREVGALGPGTYVLQSCEPEPLTILGRINHYLGCGEPWTDDDGREHPPRPWQEEGRFEVGAARLVLKDVIAERGAAGDEMGEGPWLAMESARLDGATGGVEIVHTRDACVDRDCIRRERRVDRTRLSARLPAELDLQAEVMGEIRAELAPMADAPEVAPSVALGDLQPAGAPSHALARDITAAASARVHPPWADERSPDLLDPPRVKLEGGDRLYHVHNTFRRKAVGDPERALGDWIRDPDGSWFLPLTAAVGDRTIHAFAVYGVTPGPYTGPVPVSPTAATIGATTDSTTGTEAGPGAPVDPNRLDPDAPDIAGLIRDWRRVARPSDTVDEDVDYRYDAWGRAVGVRGGGIITGGAPPHDRGGRSSEAYLWSKRNILDSVDHCTLGQYVIRSLEGRGIAECRGRYRPSRRLADYTDMKADSARSALEAEGYDVALRISHEASSEADALTVVSQRPAAGSRLDPGEQVTLLIRGPYSDAAVAVPDLADVPASEARDRLEALGLNARIVIGARPRNRSQSLTVLSQDPAPRVRIARGDTVRLTAYGRFAEEAEVPRVVGLKRDRAAERVREAGLTPRVRIADRPRREDQANQVTAQEPDAGTRLAPGSEVRITAFADWTPPVGEIRPDEREANCRRRLAELRQGRDASTLRALRQLGQSCPGTPGIGPAIAEVQAELDRQREGDRRRERERERQRARCSDYVQRGNAASRAGRLQEAIRIFRAAQGEGCRATPSYDETIAKLERQIAQRQQNRRQCDAFERQAREAMQAGDYERAAAITLRASANDACVGRQTIADISEKAMYCRIAIQQNNHAMIRQHGCRVASGGGGGRQGTRRPPTGQPTADLCPRSLRKWGRTIPFSRAKPFATGIDNGMACDYDAVGVGDVVFHWVRDPSMRAVYCSRPTVEVSGGGTGHMRSRRIDVEVQMDASVEGWQSVARQALQNAERRGVAASCP